MIYLIYLFGGFFIVLCLLMLYVFYRGKHFGTFLMGICYGLSGLLAITLPHWWPLVVGFVMVWLLRLMGMEPAAPAPGSRSADDTTAQNENAKDAKDAKDTKASHFNN